jgi:hypothetical protein
MYFGAVGFTCTKQYFGELPIRTINFSDQADKARYNKMLQLVEQMLDAKKQLAAARTERDKTFYESKCASLDPPDRSIGLRTLRTHA